MKGGRILLRLHSLALERNEMPRHVAMWMKLEGIMLSEINQLQTSAVEFQLEERSVHKFLETESRMVVTRAWERGRSGAVQ